MFWLEWAFHFDTNIVSLLWLKLGKFHADLLQMQAGDLFIKLSEGGQNGMENKN